MNRHNRRRAEAQQRAQYQRLQKHVEERAARLRAAGQDPGRTLAEIDTDLEACLNVVANDDGKDEVALETKIDHLEAIWLERFRAIGLSEEQIAQHERERNAEFEFGMRAVESEAKLNTLQQVLRKRALQRLRGF